MLGGIVQGNIFCLKHTHITGAGRYDSCRQLFKKLAILPLQSQYILSLLIFVIKNKSDFVENSDIHEINTRSSHNLHLPAAKLTLMQKGVLFSGIKIYNQLPLNIKRLHKDINHFKSSLKTYLLKH
jgi:hypothetical protein